MEKEPRTPRHPTASPPGRGTQDTPHPVSLSPAVVWEPSLPETAGLVDENDFNLNKPAVPDIKSSQLDPAYFVLPDSKIFLDKSLPDPHPTFFGKIVPQRELFSGVFYCPARARVSTRVRISWGNLQFQRCKDKFGPHKPKYSFMEGTSC